MSATAGAMHARLVAALTCVDRAGFCQTKIEPAFEPGSMPVLTATGSWLFDFQPSDACRLAKLRLQETCDTPKERR